MLAVQQSGVLLCAWRFLFIPQRVGVDQCGDLECSSYWYVHVLSIITHDSRLTNPGIAADYCSFNGVGCTNGVVTTLYVAARSVPIGRRLSLRNNRGLILNSYELSGTLPESIGNITSLVTLYDSFRERLNSSDAEPSFCRRSLISNDRLSGSIPASIGRLTNLQTL